MTYSDYRKVLKQLKVKPVKMQKFLKCNSPKKRTSGSARYHCRRCGRIGGHIGKYGLHYCRHCFREVARNIGFRQYS